MNQNPHDLDALLQDVRDGVASREEIERLRERMEREPEARERSAEIDELYRTLESVPMEETSDLTEGVMQLIQREGRTALTASPASRRQASGRNPRWILAFALGAVALAVTLVIAIAPGGFSRLGLQGLRTEGTMAGSDTQVLASLSTDGVTVRSELVPRGGGAELHLTGLDSPETRVTLEFDAARISISNIRFARGGVPATPGPGRVELAGGSGDTRITFARVAAGPEVIRWSLKHGSSGVSGELRWAGPEPTR